MTPDEFEIYTPEVIFQYMVFQAYPQKDMLFIYLDGSESRKVINIKHFLNMIKSKFPEVTNNAYEACHTTSFYLLSVPDKKITHLFPQGKDDVYKDNLALVFQDVRRGRKPRHIAVEKKTLEDVLSNYGFSQPNNNDIKNLKVSLQKNPETKGNFMDRFLGRFQR